MFRDSSLCPKQLSLFCLLWLISANADRIGYVPISVARYNCCSSSKTSVVNIDAFRNSIMSQQGKRKTKSLLDVYTNKKKSFFCVLYTHSQFLCTLARFDLANRGVRQPVQRTLSMLDCLYFEKLLSKNKANVADRLATLGSTNALKVLKRKQWKRWWLVQRSGTGLSIRWKFNHIISLIHENHCSSGNNKTNEKLLPSHLVEVKNK